MAAGLWIVPLLVLDAWRRGRMDPVFLKRSDRDACRGRITRYRRRISTYQCLDEVFSRDCRRASTLPVSQPTLRILYWHWCPKVDASLWLPSKIQLAPAAGFSRFDSAEIARRCSSMCRHLGTTSRLWNMRSG